MDILNLLINKNLKLSLLSFLLVSLSNINAQENTDYLDEIAAKSCECIEERKKTNPDLSTVELGTCLLVSAKDYKDQIAKDFDIDVNNFDSNAGERLGEIIGLRMAFVCPEIISSFADDDEEFETYEVQGIVNKINSDGFISFEIKNEEGKVQRFYWLTFAYSEFDLQSSYNTLEKKNIKLEYVEQELFDLRINEYRKFNIITSLEVIEQ